MERDIRAVLDGLTLLVADTKGASQLDAMRNYAAIMALCADLRRSADEYDGTRNITMVISELENHMAMDTLHNALLNQWDFIRFIHLAKPSTITNLCINGKLRVPKFLRHKYKSIVESNSIRDVTITIPVDDVQGFTMAPKAVIVRVIAHDFEDNLPVEWPLEPINVSIGAPQLKSLQLIHMSWKPHFLYGTKFLRNFNNIQNLSFEWMLRKDFWNNLLQHPETAAILESIVCLKLDFSMWCPIPWQALTLLEELTIDYGWDGISRDTWVWMFTSHPFSPQQLTKLKRITIQQAEWCSNGINQELWNNFASLMPFLEEITIQFITSPKKGVTRLRHVINTAYQRRLTVDIGNFARRRLDFIPAQSESRT